MTTKLARWSFVLALPLSAVLAAPAERAVEVPLKSTGKTATKSTTTTTTTKAKAGSTLTHSAAASRPEDTTVESVRPNDDPNISHSIHDWVPRTPPKAPEAQPQSSQATSTHRAHWWSRPQHVASAQQVEEVKH
jgi:hypothetical protein